ncbi:MAG: flagellar biosynthetic protein FliR [candidate division KSB1 bacterium]|nr:flagellar biosynthetic protein FliR [candidate division KSB1 bacterium]
MSLAWVEQFQLWALAFVRVLSGLVLFPLLGDRRFPMMARVGLAAFLAVLLLPSLNGLRLPPQPAVKLVWLVVKEVAVGLVLGFVSFQIFHGMHLAGQIVGFQMGFAVVNVLDPQTQEQVSLTGEFQYIVAVLLFLVVDGHHMLLTALARSFELVPPFSVALDPQLASSLVRVTAEVFLIGVKIAAPAMAALFLANVALALLARTVPQMNVFVVGFPIGIAVGLAALAYSAPLVSQVFRNLVGQLEKDLATVLQLL